MSFFLHDVFLGGTCGESIWRNKLIDMLDSNVICYDPNTPIWTQEMKEVEKLMMDYCKFLLFVIAKGGKGGVYSSVEATIYSMKYPTRTLFCYLEEDFVGHQQESLKASVELIEKETEVKIFKSLQEVADFLNENKRNEMI